MVHSLGKGGIEDLVFLYHPHPYDTDPNAQLGLGLLLLATYAKKLGASVRVINAQSMSVEAAADVIPRASFLLLYGCLIDRPIIKRIADLSYGRVRRIYLGGPIAKDAIRFPINHVCAIDGYGENFIWYLMRGLVGGRLCLDKLDDINAYPFPDRSLVEGGIGGNIFKRGSARCRVSTTLLTSRGCRYNCAFCTSGSDDFFQEYKMERIEKELEHCLSLGVRDIRISDDNLVENKGRLFALCKVFKEANIRWRGSIRTHPNDLDMYQAMAESGCEELSFGVESGDQSVLNLLNKGATVKFNTEAIRNAKKAGIFTRALMMMGTPGETEDTLRGNISWVEIAKPDIVSLKMFVPYPGTDIYHNPEKYKCWVHLPLSEINNSAYRPDGLNPVANIDSEKMSQVELTNQFAEMKSWLEMKGIENRG